ncbi:MAG: diaminopimelate decarboxylase [Saprospiraceae bacterium]|jgi:diaminopimelate decarboxylase|nr:diaminopimelate decarboxylase [Saprospiraceae bacterium]MBK7795807.1 diaminopimelate decarboxylase [Saprospiraceae bacterium]MBL0260920.1 diaminopimelate decarboxylase [Saprospiraceae bacterium]MBX7162477.1 diaminopimelate decarboxylase [Saprospiraceae bacterium]
MLIQNIPVLDLVKKYDTPLYIYDTDIILRQINRLKSAFDVDELDIHFACKALNNINILKLIQKWNCGLDTVSIQEIWLGLKAGFKAEQIIYTPNCVGPDEIEMAIELGVQINIDHIETLEYIGSHYPDTKICIRINPHVMAGGNEKISVGHIDSKFGISIYQMPLVLRLVDTLKLKINGLHMHTGSDILDPGVFTLASEILFDVARKFPDLQFIDFGSGLKVPYRPDDVSTDIEELGSLLSASFNRFCKEYGRPLKLLFEPGKFLVSESGYFFVKTNVIKQTPSTVFAGVDSGLNHLIRPMFYGSYHQIENISNPGGRPRIYNVVGYICETDTFASNRAISEIHPGDILCFKNAGAYCFSMSSNYNSRFRPAEVMLYEGKDFLIRQRETIEDLLKNQILQDF